MSAPVSDLAPVAPASVPVQETNILRFLNDHLGAEHEALLASIATKRDELEAAESYRLRLEAIAAVSGVELRGAA